MPVTRDEAFAALKSLNPAPIFLEAYRSRRLPCNLDLYFAPPEEFFIAPESQARYTGDRLIPILDDGNFGRVLFIDPATQGLIQMGIESPEESRKVFVSWQDYLEDLMITLCECTDWDKTQLRLAAELIGYERVDEYLARFADP